jgi:hypothetical protein
MTQVTPHCDCDPIGRFGEQQTFLLEAIMIGQSQAYWLRAVSLWFLLMAAETLQGLWSVKLLTAWLGREVAGDDGVFTGALIFLLIAFVCLDWIPARDAPTLLLVGSTWTALTMAYQLMLGHLVFDRTWSEVAGDFDLFHGRVLPPGLIALLFAPLLAARLRVRTCVPSVQHAAGRKP